MPRLSRQEIPGARPPHQLVPGLGRGARALEACGPRGWGTPPGGRGPGLHLLALDPEVEFRGGLAALVEAQRWLSQWRADEALAALLIGCLSYDLGRSFESVPTKSLLEVPVPPVSLAGFRAAYLYDPARRQGVVVGADPAAVARLAERVRPEGEER